MRKIYSVLAGFLFFTFSLPAWAAGPDKESFHTSHALAFFTGVTDADETERTLGVEYEYRFSQSVGAGFIWERTPDGHHDDGVTVKLAALYVHPISKLSPMNGLRLTLGAGREEVGGHGSEDLWRFGLAYDFHLGSHVTVAPSINVDFVDGHEITVYGIAIGTHF